MYPCATPVHVTSVTHSWTWTPRGSPELWSLQSNLYSHEKFTKGKKTSGNRKNAVFMNDCSEVYFRDMLDFLPVNTFIERKCKELGNHKKNCVMKNTVYRTAVQIVLICCNFEHLCLLLF